MCAERRLNMVAALLGSLGLAVGCTGGHSAGLGAISGTVTEWNGVTGAAIADVTMMLSGAQTAATTTDAAGRYEFAGLTGGDYAVTASRDGFVFTPADTSVTVIGSQVATVDFVASPYNPPWTHLAFACDTASGKVCCFRHIGPGYNTVSCEATCPSGGAEYRAYT